MPELPEVEAVCRRLREQALGAVIESAHFTRPGITAPQETAAVVRKIGHQRRIETVRRRGKNILVDLTGDVVLHIHLRMTGDLRVVADHRFRPVTTRAWFELADGRAILFNDPRALGRVHLHSAAEAARVTAAIGLEPLDPGFTFEVFETLARRSPQSAKLFLLDQTRVAGIGNIYAAEALFESRIDPRKPAQRISRRKLAELHAAIVGVLGRAVQSAWIAYNQPGRFSEAEWFPVQVYGREGQPCGRCRRLIRRMEQGGRSTYFCPGCQR